MEPANGTGGTNCRQARARLRRRRLSGLAVAGTLRCVHDSSPIGLIIHLAVTPAPLHSPSGGLAWQGFRPAGSTPTFDRMGRLPNDLIVESTPDLVVAFPGGEGTADLVSRARAAGVPVEQAYR